MVRAFFLKLFLFSSLCIYPQETGDNELYFWINRIREDSHLPSLEKEFTLEDSARIYSLELMERGILSHRDVNHRGPWERYTLLGGTAMAVGEILGTKKSSQSLQILEEMWLGSDTHRAQILNPLWTAVGIKSAERDGVEIYVVQFSTSLVTHWQMAGTAENYLLNFNPLNSCDALGFHDVLAGRTYIWKRGEDPVVIIKKDGPSLLLEIFLENKSFPSNRIVLY